MVNNLKKSKSDRSTVCHLSTSRDWVIICLLLHILDTCYAVNKTALGFRRGVQLVGEVKACLVQS